ncbi:MAG: hypothetical protein ABI586_06570, partial [Candidatus Nanopelagicales bacterium]
MLPALFVTALLSTLGPTQATADKAETTSPQRNVVVIAVSGLRWTDINAEATPALSELVNGSATAQLSVRSVYRVTCPVDGWLTLGAGRRAAAQRDPDIDESKNVAELNEHCPSMPAVADGHVEGWDSLVSYNEDLSFNAKLGQLSDAVEQAEGCATAVGPGAAVALANSAGAVGHYVPRPDELTTADVEACALTVVDAATIDVRPGQTTSRAEQVAAADAAVAQILTVVPDAAIVMLVGIADDESAARLHVLAVRADDLGLGQLTSSSTRLPGLVLATDLTPTIFEMIGLPAAADFVGAPISSVPAAATSSERVQDLILFDRKVTVYSSVAPAFFTVLVALQLLLYASAAFVIRRRGVTTDVLRRVLRMTGLVALFSVAVPVSTFLANLVPWWTWTYAHLGLVGVVLAISGLLTALAQLARKAGGLLGEVTVMTVVTSLVLAVDVVGIDQLQTASLMGYSPVIAGRFYGFGNVAFVLFATASILGSAFLAAPLLARRRRTAAAVLVASVGVATLLVDGLPSMGSDFGGMLAIAPAFGVLLFGVLEIRVTLVRFAGLLLGGLLAVMTVAVIDWLRPAAEQSHLGRFIQQILDGELTDVVSRKVSANLNVLGSGALGLLVPFAVIFGALVLLRGRGTQPAVLTAAFARVPILRPALAAWLVAMLIGFAVNDSGVAIPGVGIMLTLPILIVISTRVLEQAEPMSGQP